MSFSYHNVTFYWSNLRPCLGSAHLASGQVRMPPLNKDGYEATYLADETNLHNNFIPSAILYCQALLLPNISALVNSVVDSQLEHTRISS